MLKPAASVGSPASVPPARMERDLVAVFGGGDRGHHRGKRSVIPGRLLGLRLRRLW